MHSVLYLASLNFSSGVNIGFVCPNFTKFAAKIIKKENTETIVKSAIRACKEGRFGPCLIDFPVDILQNQRESSLKTGKLHGCKCFVDGDVNLYFRRDFVCYMQEREWKPGKPIEKPSDTSDSSDTKRNLKVVRT